MKFNLSDYLNKMFFGQLPKELKHLPKDANQRIIDALGKQKIKSIRELNYVKFIEDVAELFVPEIIKSTKANKILSPAKVRHLQYINRIVLTSLYHRTMQDRDGVSLEAKVETAYFARNFILTFSKIYGIDVIHGQQEFIAQTIQDEIKFQEDVQTISNIMAYATQDDLLDIWKHPASYLKQLSEQLCNSGFTEDDKAFYKAFSKSLTNPCNWLKKRTAFLFLLHLIFEQKHTLSERLLIISETRFTFKKNKVTRGVLRVQYSQIHNKFGLNDRQLGDQFLEIYHIYHSIFRAK